MGQLLAIALWGAIGSVLRYILSVSVQSSVKSEFPYGILLVNSLGCFLIGLLATLFLERFEVLPIWRAGILVGFLGGFTTFSTFTNDAINLLQAGEYFLFFGYVFGTLFICLFATWIGVLLARSV